MTTLSTKSNWFKTASALALALATSTLGCGAGDIGGFDASQSSTDEADDSYTADDGYAADESMELGSMEQGLMSCTNPDGTNSAMAALAVAAAQELKRWQPTKDFVMFNTSGQSEASPGMQQAIKLQTGSDASGARGKSRCADGKCARVQAILDMQYEQANNKVYFQGTGSTRVLLSPAALRSRLVAKLYEQKACDDSPRDNDPTACPKEEHVLTFQSSAKGSCDTNFYFKATKTNGTALAYPNQLKNKLKWADQTNGYINFQNLGGGVVSIDPTYGLNEDDTSSAGSCMAVCTRISLPSVVGQCCSCGGATKKFVKSAWSATTFLCQ